MEEEKSGKDEEEEDEVGTEGQAGDGSGVCAQAESRSES